MAIADSRLLIDMDGTLAKFRPVDTMETLYEKGYFRNLEPMENVIEAIRSIIHKHPEMQVYIMSAVLSDSMYSIWEKNEWLDQYLPEIDLEHRIFPPCGENKLDYVPEGIRPTDYLLDDYTANLVLWEPPARGIKLLNGINHTKESWNGNMLRFDKSAEALAQNIMDIMDGKTLIQDERPLHQFVALANKEYEQKVKNNYISEEVKDELTFLSSEQAIKALEAGIHICSINDYPEYQGIHAGKFLVQELGDSQNILDLYESSGIGIVHQAFISPYYDNAKELKEMLQRKDGTLTNEQLKKTVPKKLPEVRAQKF